MTSWHRILARYPEGTTEYEFAKRILFFKRRQALLFQELGGSPRIEAIPTQTTDRWYTVRESVKTFANIINPRNLLP